MTQTTMDKERKPIVRRPDVLRKLNADSLYMIERGLLGDLPNKLKPMYGPVRGRSNELLVAKPSGFLSSCLPVIPDSPGSEEHTSSDEESESPLKKSFSFREKFSRISFLGKHKEKPKSKTMVDGEHAEDIGPHHGNGEERKKDAKTEHDLKSNKRFWLFRHKDTEKKNSRPAYTRSKSFEFLPRAIREESEELAEKAKKLVKNSASYVFGSNDTMGDAWTSNESLEYIANDIYYDNDDCGVFLKSIREISPDSSKNNSSMSTVSSVPSGLVTNIFAGESVQNLLAEFDKAVDLFSENYLSDCEPYTKSVPKDSPVKEKRKSSSFSTLPSPKVLQMAKVNEVSDDFKKELTKMLSERRASVVPGARTSRRGSVTDWFVLEDQAAAAAAATVSAARAATEQNKYRRAQKKPMNRVRRMSSTKYGSRRSVITLGSRVFIHRRRRSVNHCGRSSSTVKFTPELVVGILTMAPNFRFFNNFTILSFANIF